MARLGEFSSKEELAVESNTTSPGELSLDLCLCHDHWA